LRATALAVPPGASPGGKGQWPVLARTQFSNMLEAKLLTRLGKYFAAVLQMRRDFVNDSPTRDGYQ